MRSRPTLRSQPPARRPRAFTLVEVLVALVLLSCGALGVVATSAMAIRSTSEAESEIAATAAARHRVELLAAGACGVSRDMTGAETSPTIREAWSIRVSRNATRLVSARVEYDDRGGRETIVLHRLATC